MGVSSFSDSALTREVLLTLGHGQQGDREEGQAGDSTAVWKLTFGQRMGISSHGQPLNPPIYSQFSHYTGLQSKLCCWQGSPVTDIVAKCWITLTVV